MNISEIIIYSHSGEIRRVKFRVTGLNIVTGHSSTGKSALSDIVEYCMGRSTFNIPEGPIRDKVSWYGVIYQFHREQVLIAKPVPAADASSCSRAMIRRGASVSPPHFSELQQNADDETVISVLSGLLGIPANRTQVPQEHSRRSFSASIKHTYFYVFQKQGLIANKDQLFYRQNEQFMPQAIKDTLPILLRVANEARLEIDAALRAAKRDLRIAEKQLAEAQDFSEKLNVRAMGLLSEAQQVGILARELVYESTDDALTILSETSAWKPTPTPDEDMRLISELEEDIAKLRTERVALNETLRATQLFAEKENGFTTEAREQKSRLESIHALPAQTESGEWQWPFAPKNLGLDIPIATSMLKEIQSLDQELDTVVRERPQLEEFTQKLEQKILDLNHRLRGHEEALAAAIAANEAISEMGSRNSATAKVVGRISLFLETYSPDESLAALKRRRDKLRRHLANIESDYGVDDSADRLVSIFNIISNRIGRYVQELEAEFAEYPFRLDFSNLTVVIDRPERQIPMNKTGGGANHLAYHLGALLALHHFTSNNKMPIPSFLFLDQPTQVYFPSEQIYKAASGTVEETERDSDLERVRRLFAMLNRFAAQEAPGFQIIVTEHANLRDDWFQDSIVEVPWSKPPALVPEEWEVQS